MAAGRSLKMLRADWVTICVVVSLVIIGLVMVYSASYGYGLMEGGMYEGQMAFFVRRQAVFAVAGLALLIILARVDYHIYRRFAVPILAATVGMLLVMVIFGRWLLKLPGMQSVQPSELAKIGAMIYIATWLEAKGDQVRHFNLGLVPFALLLGVIAGLILLQPNLSTAALLGVTAMAMFFVAGADWKQFLVLLIFGALAGLFVVVVIRYNLSRLVAFQQDLFVDPEGTNHQVVQSVVALYRGGLAGIGLGMSEQKYLIYAAHTDCIIAITGEELGFMGTSLMVALYGLFTWRGLRVAAMAPDTYGGLLAIGIVIWIALQAALHIAVGTATTPFTGTVLPMVSYGGSSMMTSLGAVGILLNISHAGRAAR